MTWHRTRVLRATLLFVSAAFIFGQTATPTVDSILDRYVNALGGQAEIEKVRTMVLHGTMEFPQFNGKATTIEYFKYPDHFAAITEVADYGTVRTVYDGASGWQSDPQRGVAALSPADVGDLRRRANIHWNLKLREFYPGLQAKGRETIEGKECWKLEATVEDWTYDFYFDVNSGLLARFDTDRHASGRNSSVTIGDYRSVGKVLFAFNATQLGGPASWKRTWTEVKFNEPVDDAVFAKAGDSRPGK